jgi:hypothetical protein
MNLIFAVDRLSDHVLLEATERVAADDRQLTAQLLALLGELDVRRLYLGQSCASLFTYGTQVLHFSEHAAYHRIEAARAARQFPVVLGMIADGAVTLTTVTLLKPHLTRENYVTLLEAARCKSKRQVEDQIARLAPRPDERAIVRKLAAPVVRSAPLALADAHPSLSSSSTVASEAPGSAVAAPALSRPAHARPAVTPLSPERYLLKITVSVETHARLRRAQDLLRHVVPNGDPAVVIDRALAMLVERLERTKAAKTARPRRASQATRPPERRTAPARSSRHVPAEVRRAVWARDEGRCGFVGTHGRCAETGRLEFHHVLPFADGGPTNIENLSLRCGAHNAHEASLWTPG